MFGRKKRDPEPDAQELYERAKPLRQRHDTAGEAEHLLTRAATLGHRVAMFDLGVILERQHRQEEARTWFELAHEAGHVLAAKKLAALDEEDAKVRRRREELAPLLAEAEYGDPQAMFDYAWQLRTSFPLEDWSTWFERAAKAGHRPAFRELADLASRRNEPERAEEMLRLDAEHDDVEGLSGLSDFLRYHDPDAAVPVLERQRELGDLTAASTLASVHWRASRLPDAERWFRVAMTEEPDTEIAGDDAARLGCVLVEQGRGEEEGVEELLRRSLDGELHLAWLLESRGDLAGAEPLYSAMVENDNDAFEAMAGLARVLPHLGGHDDAELFRDQVIEAGWSMELPAFVRRQ